MTTKKLQSEFVFSQMKYRESRRGVDVSGNIILGGIRVGTFSCKAYAACIPSFFNDSPIPAVKKLGAEKLFMKLAKAKKMHYTDYAEHLLQKAENKILASAK